MDSRLVLTVVLVTFAWLSVGTNASNATTVAMSNVTTGATVTSNMTMTTGAMVTSNVTMATGAMTTGAMTTGAMTTGAMVMTTGATAPVITAAPPLTPNTTVEPLQTPISSDGCGSTQLCATQPDSCNPAVPGSCFFVSTSQTSGQNFMFQLSGETDGFIAASLSTDTTPGGNDTTFICARNNTSVDFFGAFLDNNVLTLTTLNVNNVKASINGNTVQCTFAATVPSSTTRTTTAFSMSVATGSVSANGVLGNPTIRLQTPVVDLSDPRSNTTNLLATNTSTTTAPSTSAPTTSHAVTLQQSLSRALLIVVGVLGLAML